MKQEEIYLKYKKGSGLYKMSKEEREEINRNKLKNKKKVETTRAKKIIKDFSKLLRNKDELKTLDYKDIETNTFIEEE